MDSKSLANEKKSLGSITYKIAIKRYFIPVMGVKNIEGRLYALLRPEVLKDNEYIYLEKIAAPGNITDIEELMKEAGGLLKDVGIPYSILKNESSIDEAIF